MNGFSARRISLASSIDAAPEDNPASEPEPGITVLRRPSENVDANPQPAGIALLVEVSNTTIAFDLGAKAWLYARAGIQEYWVLDINAPRCAS